MAVPIGLIPVLMFIVTVGISVPVALGAYVFHRKGGSPFETGLQAALFEAGVFYLLGVFVLVTFVGRNRVTGTVLLLVTGILTLLFLTILPIAVGQQLLQRVRGADPETALQYATYGWPIAMIFAFGIFIAPNVIIQGHLFRVNEVTFYTLDRSGIVVEAVLPEVLIAVLGPGIIGWILLSWKRRRGVSPDTIAE